MPPAPRVATISYGPSREPGDRFIEWPDYNPETKLTDRNNAGRTRAHLSLVLNISGNSHGAVGSLFRLLRYTISPLMPHTSQDQKLLTQVEAFKSSFDSGDAA